MHASHSLGLLLLRALIVFLVLGIAWIPVASLYDGALVTVSNRGLSEDAVLSVSDLAIDLTFKLGTQDAMLTIETFTLHTGLLVLLALVATTPGLPKLKRFTAVAGTAAGVFLLHPVILALVSWSLLVSIQNGNGAGNALVAFAVFWGAGPVAISVLWVYKAWLPALQTSSK